MAGPATRDSARTDSDALVSGALQWTLLYGESVVQAMRQSARTASLSHRVIERVSQGDLSPATLQESLAEFARCRGGAFASSITGLHQRFLGRLVDLSLERLRTAVPSEVAPAAEFVDHVARLSFALVNDVAEIRTKYQEDYLREALRIGTPAGGSAITLVARLGETASASLSVAGSTPAPATLRCFVTDVRRADGVGPAFVPSMVITPEVLQVEPGEDAVVAMSLQLDESLYKPDVVYVGALQIAGGSEARIDVPLRIRATSGPALR